MKPEKITVSSHTYDTDSDGEEVVVVVFSNGQRIVLTVHEGLGMLFELLDRSLVTKSEFEPVSDPNLHGWRSVSTANSVSTL